MKRKITWFVTSCLAILSLVVVSCAQAPSTIKATTIPTTQAAPTTATAAISTAKPVAAPAVEKPKYGGALKVGWSTDIIEFDDVVGIPYRSYTLQVTNESLWSGDWAKGPAGGYGSNESSWTDLTDVWEHKAGYLAESWEIPNKIEGEVGTIIYHIRKGVRWALNPQSEASRLVGGRELTADDVVFSLKQVITDPRAQLSTSNPEVRVAQITALDKWTVKVQIPWDAFEAAVSRFSDYVHIVPPEVVKKYGTMVDWKVSVGTGPFMLTEVVAASSLTLVRNPNYWMKDPIGPGRGNQLPYLDGVKFLIMTDWSTLLAALRTAKIDWAKGVSMEDAASLKKTAPQLLSKDMTGSKTGLAMRLDRVPFNDIRVRRAMMMAIDFEGINKNLYQGKAQIVTWPNTYQQEYAAAYLGLDDTEMPASVKELYTFNPEKAKALLKEAGYPTGFKTTATIFNTVAE
ncbi:MAG: hypothetical protein HY662_03420, partial [Chloroflexi bacterium]|nr:hypothetical protein [Chloroflexota bacterium]